MARPDNNQDYQSDDYIKHDGQASVLLGLVDLLPAEIDACEGTGSDRNAQRHHEDQSKQIGDNDLCGEGLNTHQARGNSKQFEAPPLKTEHADSWDSNFQVFADIVECARVRLTLISLLERLLHAAVELNNDKIQTVGDIRGHSSTKLFPT